MHSQLPNSPTARGTLQRTLFQMWPKVTQSLKLILSYALLQVQVRTLALEEASHGQLNYKKQGEDTQSWPFYTWSVVLPACTPVAENNTAAATMASMNGSSCVIKNNSNA